MQKSLKVFLIIIFLAIAPILVVWLPFLLEIKSFMGIPIAQGGLSAIVSNYDGPLYIVIAKTFYNFDLIKNFPFSLPVEYYAAHFPLFPIIIRAFGQFTGYIYGGLIASILGSIFALSYFYLLAKMYLKPQNALWLTAIFSIFPVRFLIVRSVVSPEALFLGAIIASIFYFQKKNYFLAGIFGAIAQMTKSPAIILFISYFITITFPYISKMVMGKLKKIELYSLSSIFIFLIPLSLVLVFGIYYFQMGNFFAYFNSGDNIHLFFPPFQIFNYSQSWVGSHWLEDIIFIYLLSLTGIASLYKLKDKAMFYFCSIFFIAIIFVSHRDISRYILPITPFLLIGLSKFLIKKQFKIILLILLLPMLLYSIAFISNNIMPIGNWTPLL